MSKNASGTLGPPKYRPWAPPRAGDKVAQSLFGRGSPRERGYDAEWDRISRAYRRQHPFCEACEQIGEDTVGDVVDHILPVQDRPDLVHDSSNIWCLCNLHHGWKGRMEAFARETGQLDMLPDWCLRPETRPRQFRLENHF